MAECEVLSRVKKKKEMGYPARLESGGLHMDLSGPREGLHPSLRGLESREMSPKAHRDVSRAGLPLCSQLATDTSQVN